MRWRCAFWPRYSAIGINADSRTLKTWDDYFGNPLENSKVLGIFNAIQSIGSIAGLPFAPYACDLLGRRGTIFLGACIMIIATALQTGAQNVGMFIASRGLIGL